MKGLNAGELKKARAEAQLVVDAVTIRVGQYAAVPLLTAWELLGPELSARMMKNQIKNKGPVVGTIYPWNVVDYLSNPMGEK